jgi:DNA-binding beta-propeller fold protein YncE/mono/diheme cytochrome c family protein
MNYRLSTVLAAALFVAGNAQSQEINDIVERGRELYHSEIGCHVCHAPTGAGLVGPSLLFGPSPVEIFDQLESNPVMGVIVEEMDPSDEDLAAISMYLRELGGLPLDSELPEQWLSDLRAVRSRKETDLQFVKTERDLQIEAIETFESVQATWTRRAKEGSLLSHYDAEVLATYDPGEPKFTPEPGKTYFYENVGTNSRPAVLFEGYELPESSSVVVGDAETHEVIASQPLPVELRGAVHTSLVSPDGRYVYIVGPRPSGDEFEGNVGSSGGGRLGTSATLVKVDAITLEPIAQIDIGGRLHHGQIFRDYLLLDMFGRDQGGLALMLLDPDTDEIIGGIRDVDLGGYAYTVWTDPDYEYIYALMEPAGYATGRATGMFGAISMYQGRLMAMRPYWVAKINPDTWEVEAEFPVPGYRPNWVVVDSANEYLYVVNTMSNVAKMDANTGEVIWTNGTGIGPYGGTLNADETELWIADKGEAAGHFGRTLTVLDANSGQHLETVFSGYMVDHVLLAPNGREMWATSNAEGRLYVYDAETRELIKRIEMPGNGDAHGLIWVHYDDNGVARTVRDQGNFHNGVHPMRGTALDY